MHYIVYYTTIAYIFEITITGADYKVTQLQLTIAKDKLVNKQLKLFSWPYHGFLSSVTYNTISEWNVGRIGVSKTNSFYLTEEATYPSVLWQGTGHHGPSAIGLGTPFAPHQVIDATSRGTSTCFCVKYCNKVWWLTCSLVLHKK